MIYTDHHIHTSCSIDGEDAMLDMALACGELGVERICFTDHCDLDHWKTGKPDPKAERRWLRSVEAFHQTVGAAPSGLDICLGIELGEMNHDPARARALIASVPELDFVLASVHSVRGWPDFYGIPYESDEQCRALAELYLDELTETAAMPDYDILSHVGYLRRYMLRRGFDVSIEEPRYAEKLRLLLKTVVENGKGIEVNTSGLRHPAMHETIPTPGILRLYRELGGERVTVGSDAHRTVDAGKGVRQSFELLRDLGFRYVCAYRKREPEFIRL